MELNTKNLKRKTRQAKWYAIKIDHTREGYVLKQIDEMVEKGVIEQYKKASDLSANIITKYKLLFIKTRIDPTRFSVLSKIRHTYGFYPSNQNPISIKDIETHKTKESRIEQERAEIKQQRAEQSKDCVFTKGQQVVILSGFFEGNHAKITSIEGSLVNVEIEFSDNTIVNTVVELNEVAPMEE